MLEIAVVVPLEPMYTGATFVQGEIPLHLTVLSNTEFSRSVSAFLESVNQIAERSVPFTAHGLSYEMFGPERDIVVTEVDLDEPLRMLHAALRCAAQDLGGEAVVAAYHDQGYRPHVTKTSTGGSVEPGEDIVLGSLVVLDCSQPVRRVLCEVPFSEEVG